MCHLAKVPVLTWGSYKGRSVAEKKYPVVLKNDPNRIENEEKRWKYMQQFRVINKIRGSISFHLVSEFRFGMGDPGKDERKNYWGALEE